MKKHFTLPLLFIGAICIIHCEFCPAQNLVPNPSFENLSSCPTGQSQINLATPWDVVANTGGASPDLFNACNTFQFGVPSNVIGYQNARTGQGYAGFYTHGANSCREYIQVQLTSALMAGVMYDVEMYVSPSEVAGIAVDGIGMYFSVGPIIGAGTYDPLLVNPQISNPPNNILSDTLGWTLISGQYTAAGGEDYITIGNFIDDFGTATSIINPSGWSRGYYRIDDVSVSGQNALPVAIFSAPNHICPGTCTDFTNLSVNGVSYQWSFPGANPSSSSDINPATICYATSGSYDVQLIATNATGSDTILLLNYITVYPSPSPQAITQSGDTLFAIPGVASYQWYFNGNSISGATDYFYVAPTSGDYNVVATDSNGCEVEAAIFNVIASQSEVSGLRFEVFPNPVREKLAISSGQLAIKDISIYDPLGKLVLISSLPTANWKLPTEFDVSQLIPGMYFLEMTSSGTNYRAKFVKQ